MGNKDWSFFTSAPYKWSLSLSMGIFFYLFLLAFLPFGINNYDPNHQYTFSFLIQLSSVIATVSLASLFNEWLLKPVLFKRTTLRTILLWNTFSLVIISQAAFMNYNILGNWHDFRFSSAISFVFQCSSVLVFPMAGVFFFFHQKGYKQQIEKLSSNPENLIRPEEFLNFKGSGINDRISLSVESFMYAQSSNNYVELLYRKDQDFKRHLIRGTMKQIQASVGREFICRCHRQYLVNLYHISLIKGAEHNMQLVIEQADTSIPVGKSYSKELLSLLKKYKNFG